MARCRASILIDQTTKPIEVLFSSGSQISYINKAKATDLKIPLTVEDTITTIQDIAGRKSICTQTASINLVLGTFQHVVKVIVLPGDLPYLVLGRDWFQKCKPRIDFLENTVSVTGDDGIKHTIQMEKEDTGMLLAPSATVVSRTTNPEYKKAKPISRYQRIKEGWGNRVNFQGSYGLSMSPDDIEEGNKILEAMEKADEDTRSASQK